MATKKFWDLNITSGSKTRSNIDMLLYSYLSIAYEKEFTIDTLFATFKEYLKSIDYKNNKKNILEKITQYASVYKENIDVTCCSEALKDKANSINRLNIIFFGLDTTTLIPYCLYVLKNADITEQNKIFGFLEKYIMRRMICDWSSKNYNNLFQSFIKNQILTVESLKKEIYNTKKELTRNAKMPNNDEVKNALLEINHTNKKAKGILYLLEVALRTDKHCTEILGFSKYDLEHILPQDWATNWALDIDHDSIENKSNRVKHIGLLGNKTILTSKLNKSIKNANWEIKKNGSGEKYGLTAYAQGLDTFKFENIDSWNEQEIVERIKMLYQNIINIWNYDNAN